MGFDKVKLKQACFLFLYVAVLVLMLIYSKTLFAGVKMVVSILLPFIIGGVIAFILNIPMKGIEDKLLKKWRGKAAAKAKRPISMVLSIVLVFAIVALVMVAVVPQLRITFKTLGTKIEPFLDNVYIWSQDVLGDYPEIEAWLADLSKMEFNWESIIGNLGGFLKNGVGNMFGFTITVAGNIIGGVVNALIAFVFAIYILSQKEKLADQGCRIIDAYTSKKWNARIREVLRKLHTNFTNFICGQCAEAVILGCLFIIFMTIFRLPYAVMIGTLIGFTSLIPIVGAFIGCGVGAFMILIDNPMQALWFVILFLIIQQLEGNLIYPKVVGNSVGLPSIWVLMSVTVGGSLFGVAGMLVFIPLMSTLYSLLRDDVNRRNGVLQGRRRGERTPNNGLVKGQKKQEKAGKKDAPNQTGKQNKTGNGNKGANAQQADESSPEQIVARLVAEQEVKVKSELEQELKEQKHQKQELKTQKPKQQKEVNTPKAEAVKVETTKAETEAKETIAGEEKKTAKKRNYYRYRNQNNQKKKANTPRT
ncbi:MAG: AI-2E family transporter [Lachnospiraceae bacterium]|nr:AI-2E family transporter [Lachnospiraceae bacterium]